MEPHTEYSKRVAAYWNLLGDAHTGIYCKKGVGYCSPNTDHGAFMVSYVRTYTRETPLPYGKFWNTI